jgi:hypothetical protein
LSHDRKYVSSPSRGGLRWGWVLKSRGIAHPPDLLLHFLSPLRERIRGEGAYIYREGKRERGLVIEKNKGVSPFKKRGIEGDFKIKYSSSKCVTT